ncbi:dTDP-4-dehydrorhamnose 3,5-epimerase family protein [Aeromonas hydrophila]|nr:dTDP-4-dehydrorhamnose 3,5-epimerase family protein [Aeromonas hydrophila]
MQFRTTSLAGVMILTPTTFSDHRGQFRECFRQDEFEKHCGHYSLVQDNLSRSVGGTLHDFYVLSDSADVFYRCSDYYHPGDEAVIRWDSPNLAIMWLLSEQLPLLLSDKDRFASCFADYSSVVRQDSGASQS